MSKSFDTIKQELPKAVFLAVVLVIVGLGLYIPSIWLIQNKIVDLNTRIARENDKVSGLSSQIVDVKKILDVLAIMPTEERQALIVLLEHPTLPELLAELEGLHAQDEILKTYTNTLAVGLQRAASGVSEAASERASWVHGQLTEQGFNPPDTDFDHP